MMTFEKFSEDCPQRNEGGSCDPLWTLHGPYGRSGCEPKNCPSFHIYRKVIKTIEKLKDHCHYHEYVEHGLNVSKPARKVTFEEED